MSLNRIANLAPIIPRTDVGRHGNNHNVLTSGGVLLCPNCPGLSFPSRYAFGHHMNRHDPNRKFNFVCQTCKAAFEKSQTLKRHEIRHAASSGYSCVKCGANFQRKDNRHRHQKKCNKVWGGRRAAPNPRDKRRWPNRTYLLPQARNNNEYIEDKIEPEGTLLTTTCTTPVEMENQDFPSTAQYELTPLNGSPSQMTEWNFDDQYKEIPIDPLLLGDYDQNLSNVLQGQFQGSEYPNQELEDSAFCCLDLSISSQANYGYASIGYPQGLGSC